MSPTAEAKVSPGEVKLLLALISSTKLPSIPWSTVVSSLNCSSKAAQERWRRFKIKLQGDGNKVTTAAEAELLLAIVTAVQLSGVDWSVVSKQLGVNNKAAQERWRRFKLKLPGKGEGGNGQVSGAVKQGGNGMTAATNTGGERAKMLDAAGKKRKIEVEGEDEGGEGDGEGDAEGVLVGGVNGSAKKRARVVKDENTEKDEGVKENSRQDYGGEGEEEELETDDDEFFEADDTLGYEGGYAGEDTYGYEGEVEGHQYEI